MRPIRIDTCNDLLYVVKMFESCHPKKVLSIAVT